MIAGMSALMPDRRDEIVPLALMRAVAGTMASGLSGAMIGLLPVERGIKSGTMAEFWSPDESSGEIITAPQLEAESVLDAVPARWQGMKGSRAFPEPPD